MIGNIMSQEGLQNQLIQQQIQLQNVYRSFDGADQRIKMDHIIKVQNQFIKCLNNLIRHQNSKKKSTTLILPYQGTLLYVHFKEGIILKKSKVLDSNDSVFAQIPKPQLPLFPCISFSNLDPTYQQLIPHFSQEIPYQRINPIFQSQDRFQTNQRQAIQQNSHFRLKDICLGRQEESESLNSDEQELNEKQSDHSYSVKKKKKISKVNDTKNITKNFSKAIISYITQNKDLGLKILDPKEFEDFNQILKDKKNKMTNIQQLREMWVDDGDERTKKFNNAFRVFSQYFLREQSVAYIYNSRIMNTGWHLKYRQNLLRALREPQNFKYIKDI